MKYIIVAVTDQRPDRKVNRELPIIFPESLIHADVEMAIHRMLRRDIPDGRHRGLATVSAGFLPSPGLVPACYGRSTSIGVVSRGHVDSVLIENIDRLERT